MKEDIIKSYEKASLEYFANSNSLHKLGLDSRKLEEAASKQILDVLGLTNYEVIYTSGNSESYTLLINNFGNCFVTDSNEFKSIMLEMDINVHNDKTVKKYSHIDISGDYDLLNIDLNNYDFITLEDEIPFFGVLIKKKNIELVSLIHGGKSTTKYRSGTAPTPLIVAMSKLIKEKYKK